MLWLAYHIGVAEQCCQMVKYNTIYSENGEILQCMGVKRMFSRRGTSGFFQKFF